MGLVENFERMLAQGQDSALLRFSLGQAYYKERNYPSAIAHLRAALGLDAAYSAAWKLLGRAYSDAGDLKSALETFDQGIAVAEGKGDIQAAKEMRVFRKRAERLLADSGG